MHNHNNFENIRKTFEHYLEQNGHRKTPERYTILEEIYNCNTHFEIKELFEGLIKKGHRISRATMYNTIHLLQACKLIVRHQFGEHASRYEKSFGNTHDHFVCIETGAITEFTDASIEKIKKRIEKELNVQISHHSLILYGRCNDCKDCGNKPNTQQKK